MSEFSVYTTGKATITNSVTGGAYVNKPAETVVLYDRDGVTLKQVGTDKPRFPLFMDGVRIDTYSDIKTAEDMFMDFAGMTPLKFKKWKATLKTA